MSFSKARIQRFNELKEYTPSPAKYNVAAQEKIKLGYISKAGQSVKKSGSPPSSEAGSVQSTPLFQTPTLPLKKKKLLGLSFKSTKTDIKWNTQEELKDKIVECNNKDLYIKDLLEQIEEMTGKLSDLKIDYEKVQDEKKEREGELVKLKTQHKDESLQRAKKYILIGSSVREVNEELRVVRREYEELKCRNLVDLSNVLAYIGQLEELVNKTLEEGRKSVEEIQKKGELMKKQHSEEMQVLKLEKDGILNELNDTQAKVELLEENFKDVNVLSHLQIKEIENSWKLKLEAKEKEYEAILKECQAISEYNIIQCEIEKNQINNVLEEKTKLYEQVLTKNAKLEEEVNCLRIEKHAYELSITTFKDTIEVLKKRLFSSDRDVEQLKEELEKSEERILGFERKVMELTSELHQAQMANEEMEMQYESTSKLMQSQVKTIEKDLLRKIDNLREEFKQLEEQKELFSQVMQQYHQQQIVMTEAQTTITDSRVLIQTLEDEQKELVSQLQIHKAKLVEETEEASEIRKKYIETSGKYDALAHQFEQLLQELDATKAQIHAQENLQEQLLAYQNELKVLGDEKLAIEHEVKELNAKYAEILGHQNHSQKIKHVQDLKVKSSELFQKNMDLESKNYKLYKTVEKLTKEIEELKKPGKKTIDKENFGSPTVMKGTQSPGPLKDKN